MLNLTRYLLYAFIIAAVTVFAIRRYRFRQILLCYLSFMLFIQPDVFSPTFFGGHPRLPIAVLLCITGWPELKKTLDWLYTVKILFPAFLWFSYTILSALFISSIRNYSVVYQQVGDILIFLLIASYVSSSTYKELLVILSSIILALAINLIAYTPKISHLFSFIPMHGYYHHGGAGLSGFKIMPLLLFMYNRNYSRLTKILIFTLIIFASLMAYLSGSRTAMIGTFIVLLLYKRTLRWWLSLLLIGTIAFYLGTNYADSTFASERVERVYTAFKEGNPSSITEVEFRINHLEIAFEALQEQPILGYGYGSWNLIRGQAYGVMNSALGAHSAYALLLSETGLIGIILFFTMLYFCLRKTHFKASNKYQYDLQYVTSIAIITYLLLGFNSISFWNREFIVFLGISAGSKVRIIMNSKYRNQ